MDYAYEGNAASAQIGAAGEKAQLRAVEKTELDALPVMGERAEQCARKLEGFVERFHGPKPENSTKDAQPHSCHRTQIDRIGYALSRIEEATGLIEHIG